MYRQRDEVAVLHEIAVDVPILEILVKDRPHPVFQMDAVVVIQIFRFDLFIRADQPELPGQRKGRVHAVDDSSKDGVSIYVVIRQLKQTVDISLLVAQDAVIVVTGEVARVG